MEPTKKGWASNLAQKGRRGSVRLKHFLEATQEKLKETKVGSKLTKKNEDKPKPNPLSLFQDPLTPQENVLDLFREEVNHISWKDLSQFELIDRFTEVVKTKNTRQGWFKSISDCFRSSEAVEVLMKSFGLESREEACEICQQMLKWGVITPATGDLSQQEREFKDDRAELYTYATQSMLNVSPGSSLLRIADEDIDNVMSEKQVSDFHDLFWLMDTEHNKEIKLDEFEAILIKMLKIDSKFEQEKLKASLIQMDEDNSGTIDFQEFKMFFAKQMLNPISKIEMLEACRIFDRGSGRLTTEELQMIYQQFGYGDSDYQIDQILVDIHKKFPEGATFEELIDWCYSYKS